MEPLTDETTSVCGAMRIGDRKEWSDLDFPVWIKTGPEKQDVTDGGEEWFGHLFGILA